jgi:hemerythrin
MDPDIGEESQGLVEWNDKNCCLVSLVDIQHQGILKFINDWRHQIVSAGDSISNLAELMKLKMGFLDRFSKTHLCFEEKMLSLLVQDFEFPREEYERHLRIHQRFINEFTANVNNQLHTLGQRMDKELIDNLSGDALSDVARWWQRHITGPTDNLPAGPDYVYRLHLQNMPGGDLVVLLNRLLERTCKFAF